MFMQHVTPNVQTDVHIGLTPKGGGGFFASVSLSFSIFYIAVYMSGPSCCNFCLND